MKKWLIWCLTVLAMVCLIPGTVLNVKAAEQSRGAAPAVGVRRHVRSSDTENMIRTVIGFM